MVSSVNGAVCAVRSSFWGTTAHCAPRTPLKPTPALLTDPRIRAAYSEGAGIYRIVPMAVAVPRGVEELQEVVRWAGAEIGRASCRERVWSWGRAGRSKERHQRTS